MVEEGFEPHPWLRNPHVQTLLARAVRARAEPRYARIRLDTPDGDFLDLDVWEGPERPAAACLLLHGLEGCAESGYIVATAAALARRGVRPVALNFRGCSGEPNLTPGSYHSGRTDDIVTALAWLGERFPGAALGAVGFSLGGNALLNLAGRDPEAAGLRCGVAVSVPYELAACADALERGAARGYATYFLRSLRAKAREKARRFPDLVPEAATRARTVREFDDLLTAPLHGFASAEDYYQRCSARRFVSEVELPMLLVQSADDPLVPAASIPADLLRDRPHLALALTEYGGHVGFLDRRRGAGPDGWLERSVSRWVAERLGAGGGSLGLAAGGEPGTQDRRLTP